MRRLIRLLAALALLLGAGAAAYAVDGPAGTPTPPSKPGDPFNGATLPPGDFFVVTPSDGATQLGDPVDPEAVQSQVDADGDGVPDAAASGSATPSGTGTDGTAGTPGSSVGDSDDATDAGDAADRGVDDGSSGVGWWVYLVGAAALGALAAAAWRFWRSRTGGAPEA